jgi:hypothetical protein
MHLKSFKIGKSNGKPDKDTAEAGDTLTAQIADMEEQVNNKTKELEATEQELKELSDTAKVSEESEEDEDTPPQPHGPLDELTVTPEDELLDIDDIGALLGEADEGLKVVEVTAGADAPDEGLKVVEVAAGADAPAEAEKEPANAEAEKEPSTEKEDDSINSLFNQEDDEVNPLANLINSLPDVTAQELLDDLGEIKEIIREWERS